MAQLKEGKIAANIIKATGGMVAGAVDSYFTAAMPQSRSNIHDASALVKDIRTTFADTTSKISPVIRNLKRQASFRSLYRWYTGQSSDFDTQDGSSGLNFDDPDIDQSDIAESQISEAQRNTNQLSKTVVDSAQHLMESQIAATANIVSTQKETMAIISAGFDKTNQTLDDILKVITKNTAAIIGTVESIAQQEKSNNDEAVSSGFSISNWRKVIKDNIMESTAMSQAQLAKSMIDAFTQDKTAKGFASNVVPLLIDKMAPQLTKNLQAMDQSISDTITNVLIRLGENTSNDITGKISRLLGLKSNRKDIDHKRAELEVKAVSFDTVARESIVNAIPGYLRKILVAVGGDDMVYDYRSRSFTSRAAQQQKIRNSVTSTDSLTDATQHVQNAFKDATEYMNGLYDMMITDLGAKTSGGQARNIIDSFRTKRGASSYMKNLLKDYKLDAYDKNEIREFVNMLTEAAQGNGARDISNQVARTNIDRNHRVRTILDEAELYEVDTIGFEDDVLRDLETIANNTGLRRKKRSKGSSGNISPKREMYANLSGSDYTNMALYEIYRRLNAGINVFQVGSGKFQSKPYKKFGDDYLKRPGKYKPKTIPDQESRSAGTKVNPEDIPDTDRQNDLLNNELEDGSTEDLARGERVKRWGKRRGSQLRAAMFNGSPEQVKAVFSSMMNDVTDVASDSVKKGAAKINSSFGNISGMLQHKIFGTEYSYQTGVDEEGKPIYKHIKNNEKGGIYGFIRDNIKESLADKKNKASKWAQDVASSFKWGNTSGSDEDRGVEGKRKKLIMSAVGAYAGMGLLGGPMGLIAGVVAGGALSGTDISKKIKEKLLGQEETDQNGNQIKKSGIIVRAVEGITDPIRYQMEKTFHTAASSLKNNILKPLGNLGEAIRDRVAEGAKHSIRNFLGKVFDNAATRMIKGAMSKFFNENKFGQFLKDTIWGGIKKVPGSIFRGLIAIPAMITRGMIRGGSDVVGNMINGMAQHIAGGTNYKDGRDGKEYFRDKRDEQHNAQSRELGSFNDYRDWKKDRKAARKEKRQRFRGYTDEEIIAETSTQMADDLHGLAQEGLTEGSIYTHDKGIHDKLDKLIQLQQEGFSDSIVSGATALAGSGDEINNDEEKLLSGIVDDASKANTNKSSIVTKFKNLIGIQKKKSIAQDEKKSGWISSIISGIGGILKKAWPFVLGGFALMSDTFRELLGKAGKWAIDNVPDILKSAWDKITGSGDGDGGLIGAAGSVLSTGNRWIENIATGSNSQTSEVTGETLSMMSSEKHMDKVKEGTLKASLVDNLNPLALFKNAKTSTAARALLRGSGFAIRGIGGALSGTATAGKGGKAAVSGIRGFAEARNAGFTFKESLEYAKLGAKDAYTSAGNGFFGTVDDIGNGAQNLGKGVTDNVQSGKMRKGIVHGNGTVDVNTLLGKKQISAGAATFANVTSVVGGFISEYLSNVGYNKSDYDKHQHMSGDYGFGNAGSFRMESTTVKTVTGTAVNIAAGAGIKTAIVAAASSLTLGTAAAAAAAIAAILAVSYGIGKVVNVIAGWVKDAMDQDYVIRTNASKLNAVINDKFSYNDKTANPIYAYTGKESDRVLGINQGMTTRDPEIMFGKYVYAVKEGLTTAAGAEVLLYDLIKNMAVEGVPFACYIAGDSEKAPINTVVGNGNQSHANSDILGQEYGDDGGKYGIRFDVGTSALSNKYTMVKKSTVKKNKDKVFADISANINRNDPSVMWNEEDLKEIWEAGKKVVTALTDNSILDKKGKVKTKTFKGSPKSGKNDEGWNTLDKLCRKNGAYFLMQCLVYINSKIDVNKDGQQWLEFRGDDITKLMDGLKDYLDEELKETKAQMKAQGMTDAEINEALNPKANNDPTGKKAEEAAGLTKDESQVVSVSMPKGIKSSDQDDVNKELRYLAASYIYAHPKILKEWIDKHPDIKIDGVSEDFKNTMMNWNSGQNNKGNWPWKSGDARSRGMILQEMAKASMKMAESQGDIFNILPKVNWNELYSPDAQGVNAGELYGAGQVIRGDYIEPGKGELEKLWNDAQSGIGTVTYDPEDVHKLLLGSKDEGKGLEDDINSGSGLLLRILRYVGRYPSDEYKKKFKDTYGDSWESIARDNPEPVYWDYPKGFTPDLNMGGPVSVMDDDKPKHTDSNTGVDIPINAQLSEGGNPINAPYKITSKFGPRTYPHNGTHKGIDIVPTSSNGETQVGSRFAGTIVNIKSDVSDDNHAYKKDGKWQFNGSKSDETGNMVTIQTDSGLIIKNMHLKAGSIPSSLRVGSRVNPGDKLGIMGNTGWSTGPHLHYQIEKDGVPIDPTSTLNGNQTVGNFSQNGSTTYDTSSSSGITYDFGTPTVSDESSSSSSGMFGEFISKLKETGNHLLYKLTGGLLGSESSNIEGYSSNSSYSGSFGSTGMSSFGSFNLATSSNSQWINCVKTVKQAVAAQSPEYNQSGYINITCNGKTIRTRTDCTGIICSMLKLYGVVDDGYINNSYGFLKDGAIPKGFDKAPWPGWDGCIEGDIIVRGGHAEVFSHTENGKHKVYSGGSTKSLRSAGPTYTGHESGYECIWRPQEQSTSLSPTNMFANGVQMGVNVLKNALRKSSVANDPASIWNYLKSQGYSDVAIAGIMGCWQSETGNDATKIEGNYLKSFPGYDAVMQDNNTLDEYTKNILFPAYDRSNLSIKKEQYKGNDGHYYPGFGLAQWTGSRGYNLLQFAKSKGLDWRSPDAQLEFFNNEMAERDLIGKMNSTDSSKAAARKFAIKYEGISPESTSRIEERENYASMIYNKYHGSGSNNNDLPSDANVGGPDVDSMIISSPTRIASNTSPAISRSSASRNVVTYKHQTPISTSNTSGTETGDSNIDPEKVVEVLYMVLDELRSITGNTSNANSLLDSINKKEFGKASQQVTGNRVRATSQRSSYSFNNTIPRNITSMARP